MPKRKLSFRLALIEMLEHQLLERIQFAFQWNCTYCGKKHEGNLLKKVHRVDFSEEDQIIQLWDADSKLFAAIWISKNKKINNELSERYRNAGTIYIQVNPETDGETIVDCLSKPCFVGTCLNPKCKTCKGFLIEKNMIIIDASCWKCNAEMKVAVMETNGYHTGPDQFSNGEIAFACSKGTVIDNNYSNTVEYSYISNTCPKCKILTGDHYLFTDYYCEAMYGNLNYQRFPQGYCCTSCDNN